MFVRGRDVIADGSGVDRLLFVGLSEAQVSKARTVDDFVLAAGSDSVTIRFHYSGQPVEFADFDGNGDGILDETIDLTWYKASAEPLLAGRAENGRARMLYVRAGTFRSGTATNRNTGEKVSLV